MRKALLLLGLLLSASPIPGRGQTVTSDQTISGRNLQAIQAALPEFQRHGESLGDYEIMVSEEGSHFAVSFVAADRPPGLRGAMPGRRELTVQINKSDLSILRTYYAR